MAMEPETERVQRFILAFEQLYGRKPKSEDADGNFRIRVAQDMRMSLGGARYYIRVAAESIAKRAPSQP